MNTAILEAFFGKQFTPTLLEKIDEKTRENLVKTSKALSDLVSSWGEEVSPQILLKKIQENFSLHIDEGVINKMDTHDAFELWDIDGHFLSSSNHFFRLTSWDLEHLLTKSRNELFSRDNSIETQISQAIGNLFTGNMGVATNPCEIHTVTECKENPVSINVHIKFIAPIFHADSMNVAGIVAAVRFKRLLQ